MQHLFSEFKPVTAAEWKAQLIKDLKGGDFDALIWKNENGIDIKPFYTAEDLQQPYEPVFTHSNWDICVKGKNEDAKTLNTQLLKALDHGASSVSIQCGGLDPAIALQGIQLNYIHATFYTDAQQASAFKNYLEKNYRLGELNCSFFPEQCSSAKDLEDWKEVVSAFKDYKNITTWCVDALPFHNHNCFAYYEVALIMAGLNEYLNAFSTQELPQSVSIKTGVNNDYFIQIAKLRAIRRLWNTLAADYKTTAALHVIAETSSTDKSISDNYNNLLRTTVESMAAVAGGCNELIVTEFDLFFPVNKALSERMAVNQQLILKEESYFDKMADVACGSYYLESITDAIACKALETLKLLEAQGGYFECIRKNIISDEIKVQARQKEESLAGQKQIAIGVNKFRNEKEKICLSAADTSRLEKLPINNPVLNFELDHYFKQHA